MSHAIGLGQMNLHGFLARERIHYGSAEGLDFTNVYFASVLYAALSASNPHDQRLRSHRLGVMGRRR